MELTVEVERVVRKHPYAVCEGCPLYELGTYVPSSFPTKTCTTSNQLAMVGEAPGENEIKQGKVFIGLSGQVLDGTLNNLSQVGLPGMDRREALLTNASACHYPKETFDKLPKAAVEHCRPRLLHELEQAGVQTAVTLGAHAVRSLIDTQEGITLARAGGPRPSDFAPSVLVVPTFHPAFAMRDHTVYPLIISDLCKVHDGVWNKWEEVKYRVIRTEIAANHEIFRFWKMPIAPIEVDTESGADKDDTFGGAIKDVLCIGMWDEVGSEAVIFPREVLNENNRRLMGKLFMRNGISGQHIKYDIGRVLNVFLGVDGHILDIPIKGDRMLQSYALRSGIRGIHSLDYMGREYLGTPRWKHWIKDSMEEGRRKAKAEAKARKEKIGKRFDGVNYAFVDPKILYEYNAYDVASTRLLRDHFDPQLERFDGLPELYQRLLDYSQMLVHVEQRGMQVDLDLNYELERELNEELSGLDFGPELVNSNFNPRSVPQVKRFLELTGLEVEDTRARTIKGLADFYEVTGERPEIVEFCNTLLKSRDLGKQLSTYVVGLRRTLVDGIAHPDYSLMSSTGRLRARNPNCYSDDTEILTGNGWKLFRDLGPHDKVAQWNEDETIEFVEPTSYVEQSYTGDMVHIKSESTDQLVTPDHRVYSRSRENKTKIDRADSWLRWKLGTIIDRKFIRGGYVKPSRVLTDIEWRSLRVAIAVQADGHVYKDREDNIEIAVKSDRKAGYLREMFGDRVREGSDRHRVRLYYQEVEEWLSLPSKDFKIDKLTELGSDDLDKFVNEVMRWDGDSTRGGIYLQHPSRVRSVDAIQIAAILSGRSTKRGLYKGYYELINIHTKPTRHCSRVDTEIVSYSGVVYCVTVSSGAVVTRRNGQVVISGNSQNTPHGSRLRGQYVAREGKVYVQADYKQAELRTMAWLAKDYTLRDMFATPGDLFTDMCRDVYPDYDTFSAVQRGILRKLIKTIAYGTAYNRGAKAIALDFDIPISKARRIQKDFNAKIPQVIKYRDGIMDIAVNGGDLVTVFGRRRQFRLVTEQNWHDVRNEAAAHMPQSTANDICLTSAVKLDKQGLPMVNLIHDALIGEVDKSDAVEAGHLMTKVMVETAEEVTEHFVKWEVDIAMGRSYGDFK